MTRETKAGLVVSCSFLCLVGVVLFNKLNDKEANGTAAPDAKELAQLEEEPQPISSETPGRSHGTSAGRSREPEKAPGPGGVVPVEYRVKGEPAEPNFVPGGNGTSPERSPAIGSTPQVSPDVSSEAVTPPPPKELPLPDGEKSKPSPARSRSPELTAGQPPASVIKDDDKPQPSIGKQETVAPSPPWLKREKGIKTGDAGNAVVSGVPAPAHVGESSDSGGRDAKQASPATVPAFPPTTKSPSEPTNPEPPKPALTDENPWAIKDRASAEGRSKSDPALPAGASTNGHKPAVPLPEPPPPAAGLATRAQAAALPPDTPRPEGVKSDGARQVDPHSAGVDPKAVGSGGDHKASGIGEGISAPGPSAPVLPTAIAKPAVTPPFGAAPHLDGSAASAPTSGPTGLSQNLGPRPGGEANQPHMGSPSAGSDKSSMQDAASILPPMPSSAVGGGGGKSVPLGSRATAASPANSSTPAPLTPGPISAVNSPAQPRPPLGAPAPAASPPISVPTPPPSQIAVNPQVESYDEDTYTCKANDTFRTISQAVYHTDQYQHALQLFNRNHPLADNTLRQDSPLFRAGQPVYIPPVRILEKYYGAPVLASPPRPPSAPPPAGATGRRSSTSGSAPPPNLSQVGFGTPIKAAPPPNSMPLYRVRDGGEMMFEVANRTLGNGNRWTEIHRLNPRFDPKDVIPAGSQLLLPRDAHVNPQDVP